MRNQDLMIWSTHKWETKIKWSEAHRNEKPRLNDLKHTEMRNQD